MSASAKNASPVISVHDPEFKNLVTIPLNAVHHLPPSHLEISRLVLCRKYDPKKEGSCPMGTDCKFVHADLSNPVVQTQSIHVNYAWRKATDCTLPRLPAGEMLQVLAPNNRAPSQLIPSELVLATKGTLTRHDSRTPLSHCAHYYYNRMCNRGDRCNFVHAVHIDPTATDFQRAPPRAGCGNLAAHRASCQSHTTAGPLGPSVTPRQESSGFYPSDVNKSVSRLDSEESSCGNTSGATSDCDCESETFTRSTNVAYRRNPYSLLHVTVPLLEAN